MGRRSPRPSPAVVSRRFRHEGGGSLAWRAAGSGCMRPAPPQAPRGHKANPRSQRASAPALEDHEVLYFGQSVAFVVADTLENAKAAAALVKVEYEELWAGGGLRRQPGPGRGSARRAGRPGRRLQAAFAGAGEAGRDLYQPDPEPRGALSPCATTAWWDGDKVTVNTSIQMVKGGQHALAETLMIAPDNVHLLTRYRRRVWRQGPVL